jgi:hypothetical protein
MASYWILLTNLRLPDGGITTGQHATTLEADSYQEAVDANGRPIVEFFDADGNVIDYWEKEQVVSIDKVGD